MSHTQYPPADDRAGTQERLARRLEVYDEQLRRGFRPDRRLTQEGENRQLFRLLEQLHRAASLLTFLAPGEAGALTDAYVPTWGAEPRSRGTESRLPERIGKYRVERVLGCGGQASCLLAFDPDLQRHVVLKLFHRAARPEDGQRVLQEGRALARVRSPSVAQCYGAERHAGLPYLVMEYVRGPSLAERLNTGPFEVAEALRLVAQVAEGLAAIHACGLVHRDVKPANIILADDGRPRLVDFGLAAHLSSDALEGVSGTPGYIAPEQARGDVERLDQRTDLFALGAVLFQCLAGRLLRQATDRLDVLRLAEQGLVPAPSEFGPDVPGEVVALCRWCLMPDPNARPSSAMELKEAVDKLLEPPRRRSPRFAMAAFLGLTAAALILGIVALLLSNTRPGHLLAGDPEPDTVQKVRNTEPFVPLKNLPSTHPDGRPLRQDFALDIEVHGGRADSSGVVQLVEGQELAVAVRPERGCYVRVFTMEYDRRVKKQPDRMVMLFPNQSEPDHWWEAGRVRTVPGAPTVGGMPWQRIVTSASHGPEFLLVVATTQDWPADRGRPDGAYRSFLTPESVRRLQQRLRGLELEASKVSGTSSATCQVLIPYHVRPRNRPWRGRPHAQAKHDNRERPL